MRIGSAWIGLLLVPQSAGAGEFLSAREFLAVCAENLEFCHGYAAATMDWYGSELGKPGSEFMPYCLRAGDDPAKIFQGLVEWFFVERRAQTPAEPWPGETWDSLLDRPVQDAAVSLMPAAYICPDFDYPDYLLVWIGLEQIGDAHH